MRYVFSWTALLAVVVACSSSSNPASNPAGDAAADADTWQSWAQGFFAKYCVPCHGASDPVGRDYRVQANVAKEAPEIRCGVAVMQDSSWNCDPQYPLPEQFPIGNGPKPADAERTRAVAWLSAGAP
jgi:hypothetical protein